ncbi:MAG: carbohydrate ABC transporter permease [Lachnospirales bacterium]
MTKTKKKTAIRYSKSDTIYFTISGIILTILLIIVLYPIIYVVSASFSSGDAVSSGKVILFPVDPTLDGYKAVFDNKDILSAYMNTILYTVVGTLVNISMALITAYPLTRKDLKGRGVLTFFFVFTMYFSGGLIPFYILMSDIGLVNTRLAMVIPGALSVYNMIIVRSFISSSIPSTLFEATSIDGCNDTMYFFKMVLPLSKAVIAVVALFSAVTHWNSYFNAMLYLNDRNLVPLQIILREILVINQIDPSMISDPEQALQMAKIASVLKYALIVVATVPILCVYPFVQKYFVKGVMIGSIKG